MGNTARPTLEEFVGEFNADLTESLEAFSGDRQSVVYTVLDQDRKQSISVRLQQVDGAPGILHLKSRERVVIGVQVHYQFTWDSANKYPAVEKSTFSVFPYGHAGAEPLFRVEYLRNQDKNRPSGHFHVHAHRDEFTHLLSYAAKLDVKNKKHLDKYFAQGNKLPGFHFPTGGHRFRPILEDVLEVLRVEFDLDVNNSTWSRRLKAAREKWRRAQTAAVVRDCPEEALRVLTEELSMPIPQGWTPPETNLHK